MKKQLSKETEIEDMTLMHEIGMSGSAKSLDNMAGSSKAMPNDKVSSLCNTTKNSGIDCSAALNGIHCFNYKEIAQATDGFSDKYLIGQGAFGKVFCAVLKNTKCAVKKLFSVSFKSCGCEIAVHSNTCMSLFIGYVKKCPDKITDILCFTHAYC